MALGTQYSGIWTRSQQMRAIASYKWKNIVFSNLWSVGLNSNGELGDGTTVAKSSPVQIGANTESWSTVSGKSTGALFRKPNGTIWVSGSDVNGNFGLNLPNGTSLNSPTQIGTSSDWSMAAMSSYHSLAVKTNGTLWAWGRNNQGALGSDSAVYRSSPVQVGALTTWSKVSVSRRSSFAIKTDGTLWSFGYNATGALGINTVTNRSSPVQIGAAEVYWTSVQVGRVHTLATKSDGTMWSWGNGEYGEIGLNNSGQYADRSSPIQVGTGTTWSVVYAAYFDSLAIKTDGTLWTWGYNHNGQLGDNSRISKSSPVQIGALTTWSKIAGGGAVYPTGGTSVAVKTDGTLWLWGSNNYGQLGLNLPTTTFRSSPVQLGALTTWSNIAYGVSQCAAIKTDGTLWVWGANDSGQLGQNDLVNRSSPTQIGAGTDWYLAGIAYKHALAIKTNGTLWAWGVNDQGQFGTNDLISKSSPVQIGALTTWSMISLGSRISIALKNDGTLWAWGRNNSGQLGLGDVINRSSPTQIGALSTWSLLSMNGYSNGLGVIKTDNSLWRWGDNSSFGNLGDNTRIDRSSPVQIGSIPIAATTNWSNVYAGTDYVIATKTDGTMWLWGSNLRGKLGLNQDNGNDRSSPVQLGTDTNWALGHAANYSSFAIKTTGTLWAWGLNDSGQLGINSSDGPGAATGKSSPIQVGALTNWSKVVNNLSTATAAIKTDGTLWTWGMGTASMFTSGPSSYKSSPTQVGTGTTWTDLYATNQRFHIMQTYIS